MRATDKQRMEQRIALVLLWHSCSVVLARDDVERLGTAERTLQVLEANARMGRVSAREEATGLDLDRSRHVRKRKRKREGEKE